MIHFLILKLKSISWLRSDRIDEKEGKWEKHFFEFCILPNSINIIELVLFKQCWKAVYGCTFSFYGHEYHYALKQQREATRNKLFKCNFQSSTVRYVTGDSKRSNLRNREYTPTFRTELVCFESDCLPLVDNKFGFYRRFTDQIYPELWFFTSRNGGLPDESINRQN